MFSMKSYGILSQLENVYSWVGNGTPFQSTCLENLMDRGAGWATVHGVAQSDMTECTCTHKYRVKNTVSIN